MYFDTYSDTLTGRQLVWGRGGGGGGGPFLPFFFNQEKCPDFGPKGFNCADLLVKFLIQNNALRLSNKKL